MTLSLRRQAKSKRVFLSLHNIPDIHGLKAEVYAAVQKLLFKIIPNREGENQGGCAKHSIGRVIACLDDYLFNYVIFFVNVLKY